MANVRRMSKMDYENKLSWLYDTAETPKDKKNLKKDIANLKKQYKAGRIEAGMKKAKTTKTVAAKKPKAGKAK